MIFRCTKKVRDFLGLADADLVDDEDPSVAVLTEWYCRQIFLARHRCLLFTQASTLFTFRVPAVRKRDVEDFGALFRAHLERAMVSAGFSPEEISRVIDAGPDRFAKTRDRSVTGSMNDFAFACKFHIADRGHLDTLGLAELHRSLNDMPMKAIGMGCPDREFKKAIAARGLP